MGIDIKDRRRISGPQPNAVRFILLAIAVIVIPEIALAIFGNPYRSLHMP
jgi:hypothetical protein